MTTNNVINNNIEVATATSLVFNPSTGGIIGTTAADNATAGKVGEMISSVVGSSPGVSLTSGNSADITSIALSAGDWDVWGNIGFTPSGTAVVTGTFGWTNTTSATPPDLSLYSSYNDASTNSQISYCVPQVRHNVSGSTTVYLSGLVTYTGAAATLTACGGIYARRVR